MSIRAILMIAVIGLLGCDRRSAASYNAAIANTIKGEPNVIAFEKLFPGAEHFISYYNQAFGSGQPRWNSTVLLHGRYKLTMQFDVDIDSSGTAITARQSPSFWLQQRRHIEQLPDGRLSITYQSDSEVRFGPAEWQKLIAAGGDWAALGIRVITDQPITPSTAAALDVSHPAKGVD